MLFFSAPGVAPVLGRNSGINICGYFVNLGLLSLLLYFTSDFQNRVSDNGRGQYFANFTANFYLWCAAYRFLRMIHSYFVKLTKTWVLNGYKCIFYGKIIGELDVGWKISHAIFFPDFDRSGQAENLGSMFFYLRTIKPVRSREMKSSFSANIFHSYGLFRPPEEV